VLVSRGCSASINFENDASTDELSSSSFALPASHEFAKYSSFGSEDGLCSIFIALNLTKDIVKNACGTMNGGHPCCFCHFQILAGADHSLDSRFRLPQQLPSLKESVPKL